MSLKRMGKLVGVKGIYLYLCKSLKINPLPVKIPIFGIVRTYHEVRNIRDNFAVGRLRDKKIELYLSEKQTPCVIDCGVNVGVTVRWWFHLNNKAKVFGIDMIEEAQEFTVGSLKSINIDQGRYKSIIAALWSENGKEFKIGVSDPLYGDYGFYRPDKERTERIVVTRTLDSIFDSENIGEVDLLKIDLEAAGADALKGATGLLKKTRNVVIEIHSDEECKAASGILADGKFLLRNFTGRHLWWEKAS